MVTTPFQVPNNLLMLVRCIGILSGMSTGLDPDFNLWVVLEPYARKLVEKEAAGALNLDNILGQLGEAARLLIALPSQASRVMAQAESGGLLVQAPQVSRDVKRLSRAVDRLTGGVIFASLLYGGITLHQSGEVQTGWALLSLAGVVLVWVLFGGDREGA